MSVFSLEFILFLSIAFVVYYLASLVNKLSKKTIIPQWIILLIASLVFYGLNNWLYPAFLGGSAVISYIAAMLCGEKKMMGKVATIVAIVINVGALATLKYCNFFIDSANSLFHAGWLTQNFIIPLGISFYTFSLISYNVDSYKNNGPLEKNPFKFLLFVSYFPKLLQGPISSYNKLKEDGLFENHSFIDNDYLNSFFRIAVGLIKKIAIANVIGLFVDTVYSNLGDVYGLHLFITMIFYAIQLYCDFSGFMDICIGVSGLFGIKLEENFKAPYLSTSIKEFWRRWHITLGAWLKKYIYIPLGGNRVCIFRWILNILIVWLVSGIWHGANWTFVVWGLYHGVLLVIGGLIAKANKKEKQEHNKVITCLKVCLTFLLVCLGWILFRANSIQEAAKYVWHMIKFWQGSGFNVFTDASLESARPFLFIAFALIAVLIIVYVITLKKDVISAKIKKYELVSFIARFVFVAACISFAIFAFLYLKNIGGGESSFIYFDF